VNSSTRNVTPEASVGCISITDLAPSEPKPSPPHDVQFLRFTKHGAATLRADERVQDDGASEASCACSFQSEVPVLKRQFRELDEPPSPRRQQILDTC